MFGNGAQGFIVAEKEILFEVTNFSIVEGLVCSIASYYAFFVSYPKSSPATGILLFIQEMLLCNRDDTVKKLPHIVQ